MLKITAIVVALFCVAAASANAAATYALALNDSEMHIITADSGGITGKVAYNFSVLQGSRPIDVATKGNLIFVVDDTAKLHVLKPEADMASFSIVKSIKLEANETGLGSPNAISIDANGNVYVTSKANTNAAYAVVSPNGSWQNPVVKINRLGSTPQDPGDGSYSPMIDVIGLENEAIISHTWRNEPSMPKHGYTAKVGSDANNLIAPIPLPDGNYNSVALTSGGLLAYVANTTGVNSLSDIYGSLAVIDATTLTASELTLPSLPFAENFVPQDIAYFRTGGKSYLGLVGTPRSYSGSPISIVNGIARALRVELDANGIPILTSDSKIAATSFLFNSSDKSLLHRCASSTDGSLFWYTSNISNSVSAIATGEWSGLSSSYSLQNVGAITAYSFVPEPGTMAALLSFSTAAIALFRRRTI